MIGLIGFLIGVAIASICYFKYKDRKKKKERQRDEEKVEAARDLCLKFMEKTTKDMRLYKLSKAIVDIIPEDYKEYRPFPWSFLCSAVYAILKEVLEELITVLDDNSLDLSFRRSLSKIFQDWKRDSLFFNEKPVEEKLD